MHLFLIAVELQAQCKRTTIKLKLSEEPFFSRRKKREIVDFCEN